MSRTWTLPVGATLAATLLVAPGAPARAEQAPQAAGFDARVRLVAYNPLNVVRIVAGPTHSTQLVFAPDETVTHVAIGDSDAWLALPARHLLFLQPTLVRAPTNAQVVTRRADGSLRSYQLRLVATTATGGDAGPMFAVQFDYPDDARAAQVQRDARQAAQATERDAHARLAQAWAEGPRNWRYVAHGAPALEPAEVSDNGRQTAFRFPGNRRLPVIYAAAPDGSELVVAVTMAGDTAIVQATAPAFTLRDGQAVLRIYNRGYDPVGREPGTGTGVPEIGRTVRGR